MHNRIPYPSQAVLCLVLVFLLLPVSSVAQTRLLRFPDIHGDRVAFCHAGDIWTAPAAGGTATRLTTHPGTEAFPKFSPDGQWIAFTGQYDGDEQVYVMPATGGVPRQLTYYPARGPLSPRWGLDNHVYGWTPGGQSILFRSFRAGWDLSDCRLYTVELDGGLPEPLPMPVSGAGDLSPDGAKAVYSPLFRDFRAWKRYQGGWAADLYIFDLNTHEAERITDHPRTERDPMWIGDRIYYASDRTGTLNLYSYDPATKQTTQLTESAQGDVRWPSADESGRIVYELDGQLQVLDVGTGQSRAVDIVVPNDGVAMRPRRVSAEDAIEDLGLSPHGERVVVAARGDIFTVPAENGPTRNLTGSSDAHDRLPAWSPDGATIAFVSDRSGEEEIWTIAQDGSAAATQLTQESHGRLYQPKWSPDGSRLAYSDKEGHIYVVEARTQKKQQIADEAQGQVTDYVWSPRGGHLAFTLSDPSGFNSIHVYSLGDGQLRRVTDAYFNQFGPAWDPEGNYLFFLADHSFAPQICSIEWNYALDRETFLYALSLRKDVAHPFPPRSDEVKIGKDEETGDDDEKKDDEKKKDKNNEEPIQIDFEGIEQRATLVPVDADNYFGLTAVKEHLLYVRGGPFSYGRDNAVESELRLFSLKDRKEHTLASGIDGYVLADDGKKVLVMEGGKRRVIDVKESPGDGKSVSMSGVQCDIVPATEWATIFDEVWRRYRDFFYVDNMHGYDWKAIGDRYRELLPHVAHRSDLNYVIGEMIAELNVSHAYVQGGDFDAPPRPKAGLPGALLELDASSGRYRIVQIYDGQNEEDLYRSPLREVGVDARTGDYVLAIDGEDLRAPDNPYRLLRHKADRPVTLTLNDRPSLDGSRKVTYQPITSERELKYLTWVNERRRYVDEATGGRVGYLHVPDMGSSGLYEFIKWFYPQIRKEGLVIDVRSNGGGNVSQMLIERLRREVLRFRYVRTFDRPLTYPNVSFHGHLVCLLNETSASDGDIFPAMFRQAGLGPLIGKRSWGGVIGITGHGPLLDGGTIFVPQFGTNGLDGSWIIEGHGVEPDIEVENTPKSIVDGEDLQLDRAITEVLKAIESDPRRIPDRPEPPVRTH